MKKTFKALSALLFTTTLACVGHVEADTSFQFGIGYRSDDIHWKTEAPDKERLDTFSKLDFRDLEIFTIQSRIKSTCGDCTYFRIDGQYGWIEDGTLRESDRISYPAGGPMNDNTVVCSVRRVLHNSADSKYVADFNIGIGYPLQQCWCPCLQIIPAIGFSYDTQRIRSKNRDCFCDGLTSDNVAGLQVCKTQPPVSTPVSSAPTGSAVATNGDSSSSSSSSSSWDHRHNNFRTTWWGPWIGFDLAFCHGDCWNLYGEFEFHFSRCRRERDSHSGYDWWDDFCRTRRAYGYNIRVGSLYFFACNWFLDGHLGYQRFTSDASRDRVRWRSYNIGLDVGYMF